MDEKVGRGVEIVEAASGRGATARLLGGTAVAVRCPSAAEPPFVRSYSDFDLAVVRGNGSLLTEVLASFDFQPAERFNAINGHSRLLFTNSVGAHVDVFVGTFRMCHELALAKRLGIDRITLPLAELLLTKVQVAELTAKDVQDISVLLLDHDISDSDAGINAPYVASVLAKDWGFWRTVSENLGRTRSEMEILVSDSQQRLRIASRLDALLAAIDAHPKSLRWRARAPLGDRMPWREEPEEARR